MTSPNSTENPDPDSMDFISILVEKCDLFLDLYRSAQTWYALISEEMLYFIFKIFQ